MWDYKSTGGPDNKSKEHREQDPEQPKLKNSRKKNTSSTTQLEAEGEEKGAFRIDISPIRNKWLVSEVVKEWKRLSSW